nr:hypothetical protein [Curtobacterium flaccumfaciens]
MEVIMKQTVMHIHSRNRRTKHLVVTILAFVLAASVEVSHVDPARAETPHLASPAAAVASVAAGTFDEDVASGKLSVEYLAGLTFEYRNLKMSDEEKRAETFGAIKREVRAEIADSGPLSSTAPGSLLYVNTTLDGLRVVDDHASTDSWRSFWHRFTHWTTWHLSSDSARLILSTGGALTSGLICALPGVSAIACAFAGALIAFLTTYSLLRTCLGRGVDIAIPDLNHSRCR